MSVPLAFWRSRIDSNGKSDEGERICTIERLALHHDHEVFRSFACCKLSVLKELVGASGFEPPSSWSRTIVSKNLSRFGGSCRQVRAVYSKPYSIVPRSGVASVAGASTRTATRIVSGLTEAGVLTSDTPYAPVRLVFPAALAERWMPGLFPEKRESRLSSDHA
jgi:hypothetical protein